VARLFGDHRESDQPEFSVVEGSAVAAPAATTMMLVPVMPPVTAIRQIIGVSETTV
jgi:hypothetical protein